MRLALFFKEKHMKTFIIAIILLSVFISYSYGDTKMNNVPKVYFTEDISPKGIEKVYKALEKAPKKEQKVAVKISTGEPGGHNFLSPALIKDFVVGLKGTIVECNTAYGGKRGDTESHRQAAKDHGFTFVPVDIMDAEGGREIPIKNGKHLKADIVGSHFFNYDFYVILSHFKGHAMGGFGGAVKNMSIGIASSEGKAYIHGAGDPKLLWKADHDSFLESMAEAANAVAQERKDNIIYINVMNRLSVDCDCDSHPADPTMLDIGILASTDPIALDRACVDLVYKSKDGKDLIERIKSRNGCHTLDYGEKIGLGSQTYTLIKL